MVPFISNKWCFVIFLVENIITKRVISQLFFIFALIFFTFKTIFLFMNKKLLKSFFAVIVAVAGVFAFSTSAQAAVIGDVNNDGSVTAADVTAIYDVLLGNDLMFQATADVNNDGSVTAADVTFVYDILLGNVQPSYEKVYILGDVNGNEWNASNGVEMTTQDGKIYTAAITTKETGFSYFSFTTKLANPDTEFNAAWDEIAPYRFGAVPSDDYNFVVTEELLGTEIALTTEEGFQALQMAPGSFNLSLPAIGISWVLAMDGRLPTWATSSLRALRILTSTASTSTM